jgi:transcriptional regulator NrdR family protein
MKCPACKHQLNYLNTNKTSETLERRNYECVRCFRLFERLILKDMMGLIKDDALYELDVDGNHIRVWK